MRGRKPKPTTSPKLREGGLPRCPDHLDRVARNEWRRLARPLFDAGILTIADRAALAAYCQAYSQWVDAVEKLRETPKLIKTPSGHVQQSPLIGIANKQLELMGRYMAELGLTPSARSRIAPPDETERAESAMTITRVIIGPPDDFADEPIEVTRDDTRH
ncbi:phage terminase small subunit P27 family [Roseivivax sediminis]|uniref:Phage terminase, small subunit, putative, P27 family n=1 Tax=Roseivivax sediminis TaxID=936889 RepID=A0A1I1S850_9RHOB|nr:phage terminase small subunit P27 family [Roseivivax sediminis]SFD42681.1 phage terminase, small subunit, putative, P27 family [Roseivivax sediminis]